MSDAARFSRWLLAVIAVALCVPLLGPAATTGAATVAFSSLISDEARYPAPTSPHSYDAPSGATTPTVDTRTVALIGRSALWTSPGVVRLVPGYRLAAKAAARGADEAFHYTRGRFVEAIEKEGLRPGSYVTSRGDLSPLQAQIDLALPPNRGLSDAVLRVDLAGLRRAGYDIGEFTRVGRKFNMPGGGTELRLEKAIPPRFLKVVRR